jgi:PKD repeat protein/DNA-binding MarR family transcriptional regulator
MGRGGLALLVGLAALALLTGSPALAAGGSPGVGDAGPHPAVDRAAFADRMPTASLSETVGASTERGAAPLMVNFTALASGGDAPYRYSWSFGDGNASTLPDPEHTFDAPGRYTAFASVDDSEGEVVTQSVSVEVVPSPLTIAFAEGPTNPGQPLVASFTATPLGGEAPFVYSWNFGDGTGTVGTAPTANHSYAGSGTYSVSVKVTDGTGVTAIGTFLVDVSDGGSTGPDCAFGEVSCLSGTVSEAIWGGVAAILLACVLAVRVRRSTRRGGGTEIGSIPSGGEPVRTRTIPSLGAVDALNPPVAALPAEPSGGPERGTSPTSAPERDRPLSERILIHLYRQGRPDPDRSAPDAFTQDGMAAALGRPQSAFARALLRLEASGLVRSELAHVQGRSRRAKTYVLTPQGESAARRLGAAPEHLGREEP